MVIGRPPDHIQYQNYLHGIALKWVKIARHFRTIITSQQKNNVDIQLKRWLTLWRCIRSLANLTFKAILIYQQSVPVSAVSHIFYAMEICDFSMDISDSVERSVVHDAGLTDGDHLSCVESPIHLPRPSLSVSPVKTDLSLCQQKFLCLARTLTAAQGVVYSLCLRPVPISAMWRFECLHKGPHFAWDTL